MEDIAQQAERNIAELEDWFLSQLEQETLPLRQMMDALRAAGAGGEAERAAEWADLLEEALVERRDKAGVLALSHCRCGFQAADPSLSDRCRRGLARVYRDRLEAAMLKQSGFDGTTPPELSLKRFEVLIRLKPGVLCRDATWGFGVVKALDDFYAKVTIDFEGKTGHQMTFAYAGETLELLDEAHLLARKHRDPDGLAGLVESDPAEVVRLALRSFGPMSAVRVKEVLVGQVLTEAQWKPFWDAARGGLKADPLVHLPARRNDEIRLLESEGAHVQEWLEALRGERAPEAIVETAGRIAADMGAEGPGPEGAGVLEDRLAFAVHGAGDRDPALAARAVLTAQRLGLGGFDYTVADNLLEPERFLGAVVGLPARELRPFIRMLAERDEAATARAMLVTLPRMVYSALGECIAWLDGAGHEAELIARLAELVETRELGQGLLLWLCRNADRAEEQGIVTAADLPALVMDALEQTAAGDALKSQHQLRALFGQDAWLHGILGRVDGGVRDRLVRRLRDSRSWDEGDRRSALAHLIKAYPELGRLLAGPGEDAGKEGGATLFTSWRSYRARQDQLRDLIEVQIPENSKEIGVARSYGDLRENFEYQAAKDRQRLLMQRQSEMEAELRTVRGTDFASMPVDAAGPGTTVHVSRPDGRVEKCVILGEWDRDEGLCIISSGSELARRLAGKSEGDEVLLPGAAGEEKGRIEKVEGLSPEVKAWIAG